MGKKVDYEGLKYIKGSKIVFLYCIAIIKKVGHELSEEIILDEVRMGGRAKMNVTQLLATPYIN